MEDPKLEFKAELALSGKCMSGSSLVEIVVKELSGLSISFPAMNDDQDSESGLTRDCDCCRAAEKTISGKIAIKKKKSMMTAPVRGVSSQTLLV